MTNSIYEAVTKYLLAVDIKRDGVNQKTGILDGTYFPKILSFEQYFKNKLEYETRNWESLAEQMTRDQVIESVKHYLETRGDKPITKIVGVKTYLIVINVFFRFLSANGLDNYNLLCDFDSWYENPNSFKHRDIRHTVSTCSLYGNISKKNTSLK